MEGFKDCMFKILGSLDSNSRNCFAVMLWCLWKRQNEKILEGTVKPVRILITNALDLLNHWQQVRKTHSVPTSSRAHGDASRDRWSKPDVGDVKCNNDATLFNDADSVTMHVFATLMEHL